MPFQFDPRYDRFLIKRFKHWRLYQHQNQCYLGRVYVAAERDFIQKIDMTPEEMHELFRIEALVCPTAKSLFGAEHFNYAWLANEWHHAHEHIIPRYSKRVTFEGEHFIDTRWGQNYAPYNKHDETSPWLMEKLNDQMKFFIENAWQL